MSEITTGKLRSISQGPGYLRAGFLGFGASGKTWTAITLALGVREAFKLDGPIVMADSEGGSDYVKHRVRRDTGIDLLGEKTRSFDKMVATAKVALEEGASVFVADSITHYFRDLQDSYLRRVNEFYAQRGWKPKTDMEIQDWAKVKALWAPWLDFYLNAPMHMIICGRAGFEWDMVADESTGKKKLTKTGVKMKGESEMAFEPSLLVEMQAVQDTTGRKGLLHRATIVKDRFDVIDGAVADNPDFDFFMPHISLLKPDAHSAIDTTPSNPNVDIGGSDDWAREKRAREIACEEIQSLLTQRWPSRGADDNRAKIAVIRHIFDTGSWKAIEGKDSGVLQDGLENLRTLLGDEALLGQVLE
jgi:hypothetical protein